ncbi:MAG: RDD family protein [Clostridia bacterium]|nr:RDD family protein [Clostridia bacterium]
MIYDLQKASILKRISAFLLDFILLLILTAGFIALLTLIVRFDFYYNQLAEYDKQYKEIGIESITITKEQYEALGAEAKEYYDTTINDVRALMSQCVSRAFMSLSLGLFFSHLVLEFIIPLILKNGQTVGKKIFSVGVMQISGVKLKPVSLFVRAMLGKYAVETMVPLSIVLIFFFIEANALLFILFIALYVLEIVLFFVTKRYAFIHDVLASSVTIDMQSQMIFNTTEEMIAYKEELHQKEVEQAEYK